jgi:hypothetical protein
VTVPANALLAGEQSRIVNLQHSRARARRRHHVIVGLERRDRLLGERHGVAPVTGIVGGLAATGLRRRHRDPAADVLEQLHRGEADARTKQVDQASDEQADVRAALFLSHELFSSARPPRRDWIDSRPDRVISTRLGLVRSFWRAGGFAL